jgi:hypothetical protein
LVIDIGGVPNTSRIDHRLALVEHSADRTSPSTSWRSLMVLSVQTTNSSLKGCISHDSDDAVYRCIETSRPLDRIGFGTRPAMST